MTTLEKTNLISWATNDTHNDPGTDWHGLPNKIEPSSGRAAAGRLPEETPPAELYNYLMNRLAALHNNLSGIQLANWFLSIGNTPAYSGGGAGYPRFICFDSSRQKCCAIDDLGRTVVTDDPYKNTYVVGQSTPAGYYYWNDETTNPNGTWGAGLNSRACVDADNAGNRVACGSGANNRVMSSTAIDTWAAVTVDGATARAYGRVTYDPNSALWIIGATGGRLFSSPDRVNWTLRSSALAGEPYCLRSNKQTGNAARIVALTNTQRAVSADGITWSVANHGIGFNPLSLNYSAYGNRWIAVVSGIGDLASSEDDGVTWTYHANVLPSAANNISNLEDASIASDGNGNWIITEARDVAAPYAEMWASKDNGDSWVRVYPPWLSGSDVIASGVVWTGDCFVTYGGASATPGGLVSLRLLGS